MVLNFSKVKFQSVQLSSTQHIASILIPTDIRGFKYVVALGEHKTYDAGAIRIRDEWREIVKNPKKYTLLALQQYEVWKTM